MTAASAGKRTARRATADAGAGGLRIAGLARRDRSALLRTTALQAAALLVLAAPAGAQPAPNARPAGGQVVAGQAAISQTASVTTINQTSASAAINWQGFNVGAQQSVNFQQPSSSAVALNRVLSPNPSQIAGKIQANGSIVIVNQSGVYFAHGAQVDTAGLIVSSADITNSNFMAGSLKFNIAGRPGAAIRNDGTLSVRDRGLAALVAPTVANNGVITARMGHVVLAGAETHTIDLYGDGLVSINVTGQVKTLPVGPDGKPVKALVTNTGVISADGGTVTLTAQAVDGLVQTLVQAGGRVSADTLAGHSGRVVVSGAGGALVVTGDISASGVASGGPGGAIAVVGPGPVTLAKTARLNANGATAGGTVAIGTTLARARGGPGVRPRVVASGVSIAAGARVSADATRNGPGGHVTVLSSGTTTSAGTITARGGAQGGDGGGVEISGPTLGGIGVINVGAPHGAMGSVLLDPGDLTIQNTGAGTQTSGTVTASTTISPAELASVTGNVSITATGTIAVESSVSGLHAGLTLDALNQASSAIGLVVDAPITAPGSVVLRTETGGVTINAGVTAGAGVGGQTLAVAGGSVTINAGAGGSLVAAAATLAGTPSVVTPGVISIEADVLNVPGSPTAPVVVAADGVIAIAPHTSGSTLLLAPTTPTVHTTGTLAVGADLLASFSTAGSGSGTAGTQTLVLGTAVTTGTAAPIAQSVVVNTNTGTIALGGIAHTVQLSATGSVIEQGSGTFSVPALTGTSGGDIRLDQRAAGALPANSSVNHIGTLGAVQLSDNGQQASVSPAGGSLGVYGLTAGGDFRLTAQPVSGTLAVVGTVAVGAGHVLAITLAESNGTISVDHTGTIATVSGPGAVRGRAGALYAPAVESGTTIQPGEILLTTDNLSLASSSPTIPVVVAPAGLVAIAPLTAGRSIAIDTVATAGALSLTPTELGLIDTTQDLVQGAYAAATTGTTTGTIALLGTGAAGPTGTQTLILGSTDGGTTVTAGAISVNASIDLSSDGTLGGYGGTANTLVLFATGNATEAIGVGVTVDTLAGHLNTLNGTATAVASLNFGALPSDTNTPTNPNRIAFLGGIPDTGGVVPAAGLPVVSDLTATGNIDLVSTIPLLTRPAGVRAGQGVTLASTATLTVAGSVQAGATLDLNGTISAGGQTLALVAPTISVVATGTVFPSATLAASGSLVSNASTTVASGVTAITPGVISLETDVLSLLPRTPGQVLVSAPDGLVAIAPHTSGSTFLLTPTTPTVHTTGTLSVGADLLGDISTVGAGAATAGTQTLVLGTAIASGGTVAPLAQQVVIDPNGGTIALGGIAHTVQFSATGSVIEQGSGTFSVPALTGTSGGDIRLDQRAAGALPANSSVNQIGTLGAVQLSDNGQQASVSPAGGSLGVYGLTAGGDFRLTAQPVSGTLAVVGTVAVGAGHVLAITLAESNGTISVDHTGTIATVSGPGAVRGRAGALYAPAVESGTTIQPGEILLTTDNLSLASSSPTIPVVVAPAGLVAIAPLTAGRSIAIDTVATAGALSLTPTELGLIDTTQDLVQGAYAAATTGTTTGTIALLGTGAAGPTGTQTLILGSTDGGTTVTAGAISVNASIDLSSDGTLGGYGGTANTLVLFATGNATEAIGVGVTVDTLAGHLNTLNGTASAVASLNFGALPSDTNTPTNPNRIAFLGGIPDTGGVVPAAGLPVVSDLTATGNIDLVSTIPLLTRPAGVRAGQGVTLASTGTLTVAGSVQAGATLGLNGTISAGGQALALVAPAISVVATGTVFPSATLAASGSLVSNASTTVASGVTAITPGVISLETDVLSLLPRTPGQVLVSAPDGLVAIAPHTSGSTFLLTPTTPTVHTTGTLSVGADLLGDISTVGAGAATAGTQTLVLGTAIASGGTVAPLAQQVVIDPNGGTIALGGIAHTVQFSAAGSVIEQDSGTFSVPALTGTSGGDIRLDQRAAGALPANSVVNQIGTLGAVQLSDNGQQASVSPAGGSLGVYGLTAGGDFRLTAQPVSGTLAVVGTVAVGAGHVLAITLAESNGTISVDHTGTIATVSGPGAVRGRAGALYAPAVESGTTIQPGEILLTTDNLSLASSSPTIPVVVAPAGLVAIAPLTAGRSIAIDTVATAGALSLTPTELGLIDTTQDLVQGAYAAATTGTTTGTIALLGTGAAGPTGTQTLILGSTDGGTTVTAGAISVNASIDLSSDGTLGGYGGTANTLVLFATGNATEAIGVGVTVDTLAGHLNTLNGTASAVASLNFGALPSDTNTPTNPNRIAFLGGIPDTGGVVPAAGLPVVSDLTATGNIDLVSTIPLLTRPAGVRAGQGVTLASTGTLTVAGSVQAGATLGLNGTISAGGQALALVAPAISVVATGTVFPSATLAASGSLVSNASTTVASGVTAITPGVISLETDVLSLLPRTPGQVLVSAPDGLVAIAPHTSGSTFLLTPTTPTVHTTGTLSVGADLLGDISTVGAGAATAGTQTLVLGTAIASGGTVAPLAQQVVIDPNGGTIALGGIAHTVQFSATGSVIEQGSGTFSVPALTGTSGGDIRLDQRAAGALPANSVVNQIGTLGAVQLSDNGQQASVSPAGGSLGVYGLTATDDIRLTAQPASGTLAVVGTAAVGAGHVLAITLAEANGTIRVDHTGTIATVPSLGAVRGRAGALYAPAMESGTTILPGEILLTTDNLSLASSSPAIPVVVAPAGLVAIAPFTAGRAIAIDTVATAGTLSLTPTELGLIDTTQDLVQGAYAAATTGTTTGTIALVGIVAAGPTGTQTLILGSTDGGTTVTAGSISVNTSIDLSSDATLGGYGGTANTLALFTTGNATEAPGVSVTVDTLTGNIGGSLGFGTLAPTTDTLTNPNFIAYLGGTTVSDGFTVPTGLPVTGSLVTGYTLLVADEKASVTTRALVQAGANTADSAPLLDIDARPAVGPETLTVAGAVVSGVEGTGNPGLLVLRSGDTVVSGSIVINAGSLVNDPAQGVYAPNSGTIVLAAGVSPFAVDPQTVATLASTGGAALGLNPNANVTANAIVIDGRIGGDRGSTNPAGSVALFAAGRIDEPSTALSSIGAKGLNGFAGAHAVLDGFGGPTANRIASVGIFETNLRFDDPPGFLLRDGEGLTVADLIGDHGATLSTGITLSVAAPGSVQGYGPADLILNGDLTTVTANPGAGVRIEATGDIVQNAGSIVSANLSGEAGLIPDTEPTGVALGTLPTSSAGLPAVSLANATLSQPNAIAGSTSTGAATPGTLASFVTTGSFYLANQPSLVVVGTVAAGAALAIGQSGAPAAAPGSGITDTSVPSVRLDIAGNLTLAAGSLIQAGFTLSGYPGGNVTLHAGNTTAAASILQSGGTIGAAPDTLSTRTGLNSGTILLTAGIDTSATAPIANAAAACTDASCAITLAGLLDGDPGPARQVTLLAGGTIDEAGGVTAPGTADPGAGTIVAGRLDLQAGGQAVLFGTGHPTSNKISTLGTAFVNLNSDDVGGFLLRDGESLTVAGPIRDYGPTVSTGIKLSVAAPGSFQGYGPADVILDGDLITVTANPGAGVRIEATGDIVQNGGSIVSATLSGEAGLIPYTEPGEVALGTLPASSAGLPAVSLANATLSQLNAIAGATATPGTLASFVTTGSFYLANQPSLVVVGTVAAGAALAIGQSNAPAPAPGSGITDTSVPGVRLDIAGNLTLAAGSLIQAGFTLNGYPGGNVTLHAGSTTAAASILQNGGTIGAAPDTLSTRTGLNSGTILLTAGIDTGATAPIVNAASADAAAACTDASCAITLRGLLDGDGRQARQVTLLAGGTIDEAGGVTAPGSADAGAGTILADRLDVQAGGQAVLFGTGHPTSNQIGTLGTVVVNLHSDDVGGFLLRDGVALTALGPVTDDGAAHSSGVKLMVAPATTAADLSVAGQITLNASNTKAAIDLEATGDVTDAGTGTLITSGTVTGSAGGQFSFIHSPNKVAQFDNVTAGRSIALADARTLTLGGTLSAPGIAIQDLPSPVVLDNVAVTTGVTPTREGVLMLDAYPHFSLSAPAAGFFVTAPAITQTGVATITGLVPQAPGQPAASAQLDLTGSGTITFSSLSAPTTTLFLNLGLGQAQGNISVGNLYVAYSQPTGLANLLGAVGGQTGPEAAQVSFITPLRNSQYRVNACAISSINCILLSPILVPVTNPVQDFLIGTGTERAGDPDLVLPSVGETDY